MVFASIGILFARYGRSVRLCHRRQLLGKSVWFQIHRFCLSITPMLTLLGFLFILVYKQGSWVNPQISGIYRFLHSICGGIIVCCAIIQMWLALYRCHPNSRYRFMFEWSHRIIGAVAYFLSIPTMLLIVVFLSKNRVALIAIVSIWVVWNVTVVIILQNIAWQQRTAAAPPTSNQTRAGNQKQESINLNGVMDIETGSNMNVDSRYLKFVRSLLFIIHTIVNVSLGISFIVVFCS
jgi:hypothetical protein